MLPSSIEMYDLIKTTKMLRFIVTMLVMGALTVQLSAQEIYAKFKPINLNEAIYLTTKSGNEWTTGMPTTLLYTLENSPIAVTIEVEHNYVRDVVFTVLYECSLSSNSIKKISIDLNNPSLVKLNHICRQTVPFTIEMKNFSWPTPNSLKIDLELNQDKESRIAAEEVLNHYARLRVSINGVNWKLESNDLFLRNWNTAVIIQKLTPIVNQEGQILVDNFNASSGFHDLPFYSNKSGEIFLQAPDFIKSTVSMGVTVTIGAENCDNIDEKRSLALMSDQSAMRYRSHGSSAVLRVSSITGRIHYEGQGLKQVVDKILSESSQSCRITAHYNCSTFVICARLQNSHMDWLRPLEIGALLGLRVKKQNTGPAATAPTNCQVIQSETQRAFNVFVRTAAQAPIVLCPIICSKVDEKFEFSKGKNKLTVPPSAQEFTKFGAVSVHKSGTFMVFSNTATHEDSGEYYCTAGGQTATVFVDIIALPLFSIPNTAYINGQLPLTLYTVEQDGYSVNCTVFFSSMTDVALTLTIHTKASVSDKQWTVMTPDQFQIHLESTKSLPTPRIEVATAGNLFSKTLTLTMTNVPKQTAKYDFSHRMICGASVAGDDMKRYGLPVYDVQSGADVIVVPRPRDHEIWSNMKQCCLTVCEEDCGIEYSLDAKFMSKLEQYNIEVRVSLREGSTWLGNEQGELLSAGHTLRVFLSRGLRSIPDDKLKSVSKLVPVFFFHFSPNKTEYSKWTIARAKRSPVLAGAAKCNSDPSCLYSTDYDAGSAQLDLSLGSRFYRMLDPADRSKLPSGLEVHNDTEEKFWQLLRLLDDIQPARSPTRAAAQDLVIALLLSLIYTLLYCSCA